MGAVSGTHDHAHEHGHQHGRHGHQHPHGPSVARAGARHLRPLRIAFWLTVGYLGVQVVVGLTVSSLSLLSDAGHMATDALGLGMAWAAIHAASNARTHPQRTFGLYRLEILAALANAVLLLGVAAVVLVEAARRLADPPEVASVPVLVVAAVGLAVNIVAFRLLRSGADESLNLRGAYLEVVADLLGSIGVIVAAVVWGVTGWDWVDPVIGALIGMSILPRALRLGRDALRVLVQSAPPHIDLTDVQRDLASIDGVIDVHDLHVWTLTSEMEVATAHLVVADPHRAHAVLDRACELLGARHGIDHATLQVEPPDHAGCETIEW